MSGEVRLTEVSIARRSKRRTRDLAPGDRVVRARTAELLWRVAHAAVRQERFLAHYHRRSNVETAFAMIKAKFGVAVASRLPVAQVNEVLAKCVAHNLCCVVKAIFTAGLAPTFWPDAVVTARSAS